MSTYAELLTQVQVQRIHEASLDILENVGLLVRNEKAKEIFKKHGCPLDDETEIVKFPRRVVEDARACFTPTFAFLGRDPKFNRILPKDRPVIVTGSSAPNMLDPVTGKERRAFSDDIARIARVINELPGYDVFSISTLAEDAPLDRFTVTRLYPTLKNCVKPIRCSALNASDAEQILQLAAIVAGSEAAYRERPFIVHHYCPIVSPLTFDFDSTEMLIYFTEKDLPSFGTVVPNGGMSSPLTLLGTLTQGNAEFLAWTTLAQMIRPGVPVLYSYLPTIADMRRGSYSPGAIECGMLSMGMTQMARYYNVPNGGYIGLTNSKINDAQSGYESGLSNAACLLAGADMFNMGGLLDALMCFDFAKAAIDDDIATMMKRIQRGFDFSEENFAMDDISETGPGGMFIDRPRTYALMKDTMYLSDIADRDARNRWEKQGALDTQARAMKRVREILTTDHPSFLSPDVDAKIRAAFPDLPNGDCVLPKEWK
ncbi:MAG: trimethylamine methyltransferase family protein [Chloroflexi bacterium]|nr:trimethylamine methyltransferase family protein [Chloroflexota bacterium]